MRFKCGALALAGVLGWPWAGAYGETLTLEAAISRVLASNPSLRAEGASVQALSQQARLDGLKPAPTIGAEVENFGGTGAVSGVKSVETTLRLGQVIELGGKRQARQLRGEASVARQELEIARKRLDLAAEATKRYIAVVEAQQELGLTTRQVALATETKVAVEHRVERGVAPEGDVAMAEITVVRVELSLEHAEHELASASFSLCPARNADNPAICSGSHSLSARKCRVSSGDSSAGDSPTSLSSSGRIYSALAVNARCISAPSRTSTAPVP